MTRPDLLDIVTTGLQQEDLFPIREVSRLTGVNPITLRAWERRYGLIQPMRTESGHRLYSQADIEEVRAIVGWIERGVAVSKVGRILTKARANQAQREQVATLRPAGEWGDWQARVRDAVSAFDEAGLESLYGRIFATYPLAEVFQDIFLPVWRELDGASERPGQISEWLFFDAFLRARVLQRVQVSNRHGQQRLLLATSDDSRELALLVTGMFLATDDLAVTVLPPGQPLEDLPLVCRQMQPQALVLYANAMPDGDMRRRLARLAMAVECPVMLTGDAAELGDDQLQGMSLAGLGSDARVMQRRLRQFLAGTLDG